jgi:hypothetical protein
MSCVRCSGFMVSESFEDLRDDAHHFRFTAWRCLNCGAVVDSVIVGHRRASPGHGRHCEPNGSGPGETRRPSGTAEDPCCIPL